MITIITLFVLLIINIILLTSAYKEQKQLFVAYHSILIGSILTFIILFTLGFI